MAYYYKVDISSESKPLYKGFHLEKVKKSHASGPQINFDFSKHVLIELLDDTTPESVLWNELGLKNDKNVLHKRMMVDSHRMKCRRAIVVCTDADEARALARRLSQAKVMKRCICAIVIQDLLTDLCLFEKQVVQCGDVRPQHQLLYVSDLSRSRGPSGLVKFLREKFSQFGTILSVLVCSDDDDYAFPEGVIRFAYLSEAFAAELAFDQYVVGKERLSVTTHHNILLSQCDLRARLRDARWCCNVEDNSIKSPDQTYELNDLGSADDEPVVSSMNSLGISHFPPAYSQRTFDLEPNEMGCTEANLNPTDHELAICNAETLPIDMMATKIFSPESIFHNDPSCTKEYSKSEKLNKDYKNSSDCDSFVTCDNSLKPYSSCLVLPSEKMVASGSYSLKTNTVSEYHSVPSDSRHFPGPQCDYLNESEVKKPLIKTSMKRRKKFTPSQKLCLKSQRTGLSQSSIQSANLTQEKPIKHDKSTPELNMSMSTSEKLPKIESHDCSTSSKVASWLSHLPAVSNHAVELLGEKENLDLKKNSSSVNHSRNSNTKHKNRISVHKTPSLKSDLFLNSAAKDLCSVDFSENEDPNKHRLILSNGIKAADQSNKNEHCENRISVHKTPSFNSNLPTEGLCCDNFLRNEDPNEYLLVSSSKTDCIPITHECKTPLQAWLKQELLSSTNNCITKSQETSKSVIVCAARTKDVIISVGCSHMTCDSCYPESTDLLLGYN